MDFKKCPEMEKNISYIFSENKFIITYYYYANY